MTINGNQISFADRTSEEYGVILCDFETVNTDSNDEESNLVTSKNPFKRTFTLHGISIEVPLSFSITIAKCEGGYFDADEEESIKKWLCKTSWNWLSVKQDDLTNKSYCCIINNPRKVDIGRRSAGISFTVTCNSNVAWGELNRRNYVSTSAFTFSYHYHAKFDNEVLSPVLIITPTANGTVTIKNNTTNKSMTINNCVTNEVLTIDEENDILESSINRIFINDWNKVFIRLADGLNNITLTGKFKLTLEYRPMFRIGG